jgi:hypothetical protein
LTREGRGRAKLRLSRGFTLGLAQQHQPPKFSARLFDHLIISRFHAREQGLNFRVAHFLSYDANGTHIVVDSNE